jgi:hypothetical protein
VLDSKKESKRITNSPRLKTCNRVDMSHLKLFDVVCREDSANTDAGAWYFGRRHYLGYDS